MSRIGRKPIPIADQVKVTVKEGLVSVEGPKGKLSSRFRVEARVVIDDENKNVLVESAGETKFHRAYHGTTRALIANMVKGVSEGYKKVLQIVGVGYSAKLEGKKLILQIGFCHPVERAIPDGLTLETPTPIRIEISGVDKQLVGEFAAQIRRVRKPEPYKGKGIRYEGEQVLRKAGKAFGAGSA